MWPDNTIASLSHIEAVCVSNSPRVVWYSSPWAASQTSSSRGAAPTVRCCARRATRSESSMFVERVNSFGLPSRPIVRRGLTKFQRSKIGRPAGKAIRNVGQSHAAVDGRGTRFEAEVEVLRLVDRLHLLEIFRVESRDVHEHVVVNSNAMEILMGRRRCIQRASGTCAPRDSCSTPGSPRPPPEIRPL